MTPSMITFLGYLVQILPAALLLIFLFYDRLKLSGAALVAVTAAIVLIPAGLFTLSATSVDTFLPGMPVTQARFLCFAFYMMVTYLCLIPVFDESLSRKLFFFGIVCNYSQGIATLALLVERCFLKDTVLGDMAFFSLSNTVVSLWLLVFTFPFVFYILTRRYPLVLDAVSDAVWGRLAFISVLEFAMLSFTALMLPDGNLGAFDIASMTNVLAGVVILYAYVYTILESAWKEKNQELSEKQARFLLDLQMQRMKSLRQSTADVRRSRHDLRHHFKTLSAMASSDAPPEEQLAHIREYLSTYTDAIDQAAFVPLCKNLMVDGLLNYFRSHAIEAGVGFSCTADIPESSLLPDPLLCEIIGNLMENALDGALTAEDGRRYIRFNARVLEGNLVMTVDNSFDGRLMTRGDQYLSTKSDGSGLGLFSVTRSADNCGGDVLIQPAGSEFHVVVRLPLDGGAASSLSD